jgi:HEAT repeat protein
MGHPPTSGNQTAVGNGYNVSTSTSIGRTFFFVLLVFQLVGSSFAQHCADESAIKSRLDTQTENERSAFIEELSKAQFFGSVLRWTAVAGLSMAPTLRAMTRPGMNFNSFPGEAQISLAKLGDENALAELQQELNHNPDGGFALEKLIHVNTDRAFSLLVAFLLVHASDNSLRREYGDYSDDVRWHILAGISAYASDTPDHVDLAHPYDAWLKWWEKKNGKIALSISGQVKDPYLACLARKVEWGFPDAILDMGNSGRAEAIPILRILEQVGSPVYTLNSIRGRAQFALAELGDERAFNAIKKGLDEYGSTASLRMLWMIGGTKAVDALFEALNSDFPLEPHGSWPPPDPKDKVNYATYRKLSEEYKTKTDNAILDTLSAMVADPPQTTGDLAGREKQWQEWWAKNRQTAKLTIPKMPNYE